MASNKIGSVRGAGREGAARFPDPRLGAIMLGFRFMLVGVIKACLRADGEFELGVLQILPSRDKDSEPPQIKLAGRAYSIVVRFRWTGSEGRVGVLWVKVEEYCKKCYAFCCGGRVRA